ncbi:MAG: hypothetical protein R2712_15385 [Vicinamibacterales bacterium]
MTLGLDLSSGAARAVIVNEHAQVMARGEHEGTGDPAAGAVSAVRRAVAAAGVPVERAAVVLPRPGDTLPAGVDAAVRDLLPCTPAPATVPAGVAVALAEQWGGAARGAGTVVALGRRPRDGRDPDRRHALTGAHGLAGSVGWLALNPVEREDYRRLGGLEAEVSAQGIVRRTVWRIKSVTTRSWPPGAGRPRPHLGRRRGQAARGGDGLCVSVMLDTARYVGMAVSNLAVMLDPDLVVLGASSRRRATCSSSPFAWSAAAACRRLVPSACASSRRRSARMPLRSAAPATRPRRHDRALGADLVPPAGVLRGGTLIVDGERIAAVEPKPHRPRRRYRRHPVAGSIIVPGFIDVHVHGVDGTDVLDDPDAVARVAARLPRYGVTGFCPTSGPARPRRWTCSSARCSRRRLRRRPARPACFPHTSRATSSTRTGKARSPASACACRPARRRWPVRSRATTSCR